AKIFAGEEIAEAHHGKVLRDADALVQKRVGAADGDEIRDGLDGGGGRRFVDELERGLGAVLDGVARLEDQAVIDFETGFAQGTAIAFKTFLRPDGGLRSGEVGDAPMAELEQMLRCRVTGEKIVGLDAEEL